MSMNLLLIIFVVLLLLLLSIYSLLQAKRTKNDRIEAAKLRAKEAFERSQPQPLYMPRPVTPMPDGLNVVISDDLTEEQAHSLSKIFGDDSLYTKKADHHWEDTEPADLTRGKE